MNAGLYIHIPFCRTKCHYCSFNSFPCRDLPPEKYLNSLVAHCEKFKRIWDVARPIGTLFIGGGTPTIYSGEQISRLLGSCRKIFTIDTLAELTIETNPNTVSRSALDLLLEAGFNRLSIGVQAFDEDLLAVLGRSHTVDEARRAVEMARNAGFTNINIDLMYGLPGQTVGTFKKTLGQAMALNVAHIALYELTIEGKTQFDDRLKAGALILPDESEIVAMEELVQTMLPAHGYLRYEISNYAKAGYFCRHNSNYWENGTYLGVGAGAVSYVDGIRFKNIDNPGQYATLIAADEPAYEYAEGLSTEASFRETVIMGLRMLRGVDLNQLEKRFDLKPLSYYGETLRKLLAEDMIDIDDDYMKLTARALPVANQVLSELV
nr:radical SAM family heme chaperone HemW [Desulfobulbaceae bacterium]